MHMYKRVGVPDAAAEVIVLMQKPWLVVERLASKPNYIKAMHNSFGTVLDQFGTVLDRFRTVLRKPFQNSSVE